MSVQIDSISSSLPVFLAKKQYTSIFVISDQNTRRACYPKIKDLLPKHTIVSIKAGETFKTLETCQEIWTEMTAKQMDRHALVINLGGGVIGDMGGFCAATYKRGVDFIQIPTTLLAQVDASVGGKLGIDFNGLKNHLGVFTLPNAVLIDAVFLETLPWRELRSGFAEIIKHCLIADASKWNDIKQLDFEEQNWPHLIAHSVAIKQKIVAEDPTEKGLRKILNFGHTLGHAIETYFLETKNRLFHGEAIAAGMIGEAFIAYKRKLISEQQLGQIEEFLFTIYGKAAIKETDFEAIVELTAQDKKNVGREVRFSLLEGIGQCGFDYVVTNKEMKAALGYYVG